MTGMEREGTSKVKVLQSTKKWRKSKRMVGHTKSRVLVKKRKNWEKKEE